MINKSVYNSIVPSMDGVNEDSNINIANLFASKVVKSFLIHAYCLSLNGCLLWSLSSKSIHLIEVALNKILRKVWNLPSRSHTNIVHSVVHLPSISDIVFKRFSTFFNRGVVSTSCVISRILSQSSLLAYTFTGYNFMYGSHHLKITVI